MFDVIVPVYNAMHHVRACIESVFRYSTLPFHLYLLDDGSDTYTRNEIAKLLSSYPENRYTFLKNPTNLGYLRNCNQGISLGSNPYVVLLNSDAMVSAGYLERLKWGFDCDPSIAVINAVSTWANWTAIPFPHGFTVNELAQEVRAVSNDTLPDINNASGFFFAVPRVKFDELGVFDEVFDPGYYEESDFCMRALDAGYRVVVDDGLYIFHYGWGSFEGDGRNANMQKNRKTFFSRWGKEFLELENEWKTENPIQGLINHLNSLSTKSVSKGIARASSSVVPINNARALYEGSKVRYILPAIKLYGGVISVLQLVNNMVRAGVDANVVTYGEVDPELGKLFPMYFQPYVFSNEDAMIDSFPEADLVVATHWKTVSPALQIAAMFPETKLAYYIQDFEPDFCEKDSLDYKLAERTYRQIPNQIVKTNWLKDMLAPYDGDARIIPLGLNLDIYHPRDIERNRQVIAMARPSSARRNFSMIKEVYAELYRRRPDIKLAVYGISSDKAFDCPVKCYGKLNNLNDVAKVLNESEILLDPSTFQGFGRPGLEAMACAAAAVVTDNGGITQYAKHRYNCLLVNPNSRDEIVERIVELFDNRALRDQLVRRGLETAKQYSDKEEAGLTIEYFSGLLKDQRSAPVDAGESVVSGLSVDDNVG